LLTKVIVLSSHRLKSSKDHLQRAIGKSNTAFVVGTGVSIAATGNPLAGWNGLLLSLLNDAALKYVTTSDARSLRRSILSSDLDRKLLACDSLLEAIGGTSSNEFRLWLDSSVGTLKAIDDFVPKWIQQTGKLVFTTNYDSLLCSKRLEPVPWTNPAKVEQVISGEMKGIIHLHGHFSDPSSIILGAKSYYDIVNKEYAQSLQKAIGFFHSLIFVGCGKGLEDPNFGPFMDWARRIKGSSTIPWFILCRNQDASELKKRWPFIIALTYGKDHTDLPNFLRQLQPASHDRNKSRATRSQAFKESTSHKAENQQLKKIVNRLISHYANTSSSSIETWDLQCTIDAEGNSSLVDTQVARAGELGLHFLKKSYELLGGTGCPIVTAEDEIGNPLTLIWLERGRSSCQVAAVCEPPIKARRKKLFRFKVLRPFSWKKLFTHGSDDGCLTFVETTEKTRVEFIAPVGYKWYRLQSAPERGEVTIFRRRGHSVLRWKMGRLTPRRIHYTLFLSKI